MDGALDGAWLTPQIRFGVFSRSRLVDQDAFHVVLGLQNELRVRTCDYDERQPIWFTWRDVIVDTVGIHYFKDEDGLLRFTTTGGGRRITDELLHRFDSDHLGISKDAVVKRQFDLDKLRALCFDRFAERLYMLRFSDPSGQEYQSIDHALFQSREYIDPDTKRLKEIQNDGQVKIESFDSDVTAPLARRAAWRRAEELGGRRGRPRGALGPRVGGGVGGRRRRRSASSGRPTGRRGAPPGRARARGRSRPR